MIDAESPAEKVPTTAKPVSDAGDGNQEVRESVGPAPAAGPRSSIPPALSAWLEEIREYLSSRQDVRDGSDGPRPNEEMTLLSNLDEALRRPIFPNGNAGPSAVLADLKRKFKLGSISLDHTPLQVFVEVVEPFVAELDHLRAESERLREDAICDERAFSSMKERAERAEADNAKLREEKHIDELVYDAMIRDRDRWKERADLAEAALRGGVVVPLSEEFVTNLALAHFNNTEKARLTMTRWVDGIDCEYATPQLMGFVDGLLAAAKEGK